ncbi:MAG: thioredoxin [Chloroflexota bacterium]
MIKEPINITDAEFDEQVLQNTLPVVVDFWAPWCGPCKMVGPILEKLAEEYAGKVVVAKVNTDENPQYAQQFGVQGIPTMIFVNQGQLVHSQVGALPENVLKDLFEQFIAIAEKEPAE